MSSSRYVAGLLAEIDTYQKRLNTIDKEVSQIVMTRNANTDKPELLRLAGPALAKLAELEYDLVVDLRNRRNDLAESSTFKGKIKQLLKRFKFLKTKSGISSTVAARQEEDILKEFNMESGDIIREHESGRQQDPQAVTTLNPVSSSFMHVSFFQYIRYDFSITLVTMISLPLKPTAAMRNHLALLLEYPEALTRPSVIWEACSSVS